nr:MAG TPA: hypothetical protein [Caudoviricetes sp.]
MRATVCSHTCHHSCYHTENYVYILFKVMLGCC